MTRFICFRGPTRRAGKFCECALDKPELANATVIVPPSEAVIQFMEPTADAIYVGDLLGGPSQIRRFGLDGTGENDRAHSKHLRRHGDGIIGR